MFVLKGFLCQNKLIDKINFKLMLMGLLCIFTIIIIMMIRTDITRGLTDIILNQCKKCLEIDALHPA